MIHIKVTHDLPQELWATVMGNLLELHKQGVDVTLKVEAQALRPSSAPEEWLGLGKKPAFRNGRYFRMSKSLEHPDFHSKACNYKVLLNGQEVEKWLHADEDYGEVVIMYRGSDQLTRTMQRTGKVEIKPKQEASK